MAQLGRTTIGVNTWELSLKISGLRVTMPDSAMVGVSVFAYVEDNVVGSQFRAALLHDADKQTVLASSAIRTDITTAGWYEFSGGTFAAYAPQQGQTFVIAIVSDSAEIASIYQDNVGLDAWTASAFIISMDPLEVEPLVPATAEDYSIYLEYRALSSDTGVKAVLQ